MKKSKILTTPTRVADLKIDYDLDTFNDDLDLRIEERAFKRAKAARAES